MNETVGSHISMEYNRPIKIVDDIYWVGYHEKEEQISCNPYLIVDQDEAILIDGGSRPDFSTVMRKILQVGIVPKSITHLIYHHYDPDLCGSLPNLEDMIDNPLLKVISKRENNGFIRHYGCRSVLQCIDQMDRKLTLKSGRTLRFIPIPYAHSAGSFMTLDEKTGILFSSDLFGSTTYQAEWTLFLDIKRACHACLQPLPVGRTEQEILIRHTCPLCGIRKFQRQVMPSNAALRLALQITRANNPVMIAPQHGSVLCGKEEMDQVIQVLDSMEDVGIDGILGEMKRAGSAFPVG